MRHDASRQGRNPKRDHDIVPSELKGLTLAEIEKRLRHRVHPWFLLFLLWILNIRGVIKKIGENES